MSALAEALKYGNEDVRKTAAEALVFIGSPTAAKSRSIFSLRTPIPPPYLTPQTLKEAKERARKAEEYTKERIICERAAQALVNASPEVLSTFIEALKSEDKNVRWAAVRSLGDNAIEARLSVLSSRQIDLKTLKAFEEFEKKPE